MLSDEKEVSYVANGGGKCPGCGSDSLTAGTMEVDGARAYCPVTCDKCNATWQDIYRLIDIDNFEPGVEQCDCGNDGPLLGRTNDDGETVHVCVECADAMDEKDDRRLKDQGY
jgi:hypothetical protein